jgi:hypothetical protein
MKKFEYNYQVETTTGRIGVALFLGAGDTVTDVRFSAEGVDTSVLDWTTSWSRGQELSQALENVAEAFLRAHPHHPWSWSQLPQDILRQGLYQVRPKVMMEDRPDPLICKCHKLKESTLTIALKQLPQPSLLALADLTKAGSGCGSCKPILSQMVSRHQPASRRWHGETAAAWSIQLQGSLDLWRERARFPWVKDLTLEVASFKDGVVTVRVVEGLTADQEWDLSSALNDYWAEGFPEPLSVFLDFSLR